MVFVLWFGFLRGIKEYGSVNRYDRRIMTWGQGAKRNSQHFVFKRSLHKFYWCRLSLRGPACTVQHLLGGHVRPPFTIITRTTILENSRECGRGIAFCTQTYKSEHLLMNVELSRDICVEKSVCNKLCRISLKNNKQRENFPYVHVIFVIWWRDVCFFWNFTLTWSAVHGISAPRQTPRPLIHPHADASSLPRDTRVYRRFQWQHKSTLMRMHAFVTPT